MTLNNKLIKPALIAFLVVYFLFLVISRTPAELAASAIHKAVPNLWLTGVEGTVWSGVAKGAQLDLPGSSLPLGQINWKLSGLSLLFLSPCVTFENNGGAALLSGEACQSITGSTTLEGVSVEGDVSPLVPLVQTPISGIGSIQITEAKLSGLQVKKLKAKVSWQNGSINPGNGWMNVGTFGADVTDNGSGGITAKIFDIDAPLQVDVQAGAALQQWPPQQWQLNGSVVVNEKTPELIKEGIPLIGEETDPGTYNIVLTSD